MAERSINAAIKSKLVANEPFQYAHLVKFERPFDPKDGEFRTNANRYAYYTDAAHDITFSGNTYRADRITSIGSYSETTTARATTMNLTLAAEDLGAKVVVTGAITVATVDSVVTGTFTPSATVIDGEPLDFVEKGFKEGDKLLFTLTQTAGSFIVPKVKSFDFEKNISEAKSAALAAAWSLFITVTLITLQGPLTGS